MASDSEVCISHATAHLQSPSGYTGAAEDAAAEVDDEAGELEEDALEAEADDPPSLESHSSVATCSKYDEQVSSPPDVLGPSMAVSFSSLKYFPASHRHWNGCSELDVGLNVDG